MIERADSPNSVPELFASRPAFRKRTTGPKRRMSIAGWSGTGRVDSCEVRTAHAGVNTCAVGHPTFSRVERIEKRAASKNSGRTMGLFRELNPGPPAPEAGIMPLDQTAS